MALLKPACWTLQPASMQCVSMNENSWLYWSDVSDRHGGTFDALVSMNENSWLYWSWGLFCLRGGLVFPFPWMKIHGSIEACKWTDQLWVLNQFPWMKIHGSIEAGQGEKERREKYIRFPWMKIHGSIEARRFIFRWVHSCPCFHEWKFMALLKRCHWTRINNLFRRFPWMKIHGSIEAFQFRTRRSSTVSFPWMNIHGSIKTRLHYHLW